MIFLFRWGLAVFSIVWALLVLPAEAVRVLYAGTRENITSGKRVERSDLDSAITVYQKTLLPGICMPGVREQLASFLSIRSATRTGPGAMRKIAEDLDLADKILRKMLACSPYESNQWLSLAMLDVKRNGIRDNVFAFLKMSYMTGPRAVWIIERRLTFAAGIAPLVPAGMKMQITNDINELRRISGVKKRFMKRLGLKSMNELEQLFGYTGRRSGDIR